MNFIQHESAQKLRGGFYTDADLAEFLARWVSVRTPRRVLEPSCGDGAFLAALENRADGAVQSVWACEINPEEAAKARRRVSRMRLELHVGDFLRWFVFNVGQVELFDAAVGNPPFIRYQYLPEEQQFLAEKIFHRLGLPFTRHTNAWVPFVIAALALLRPGGRLGMVVPSELFHVGHAQSLRQFLVRECSRILILDPEQIWFTDTLQGTVLLLAERKKGSERVNGMGVIPIASRQQLNADPEELFQNASYSTDLVLDRKWTRLFLNSKQRALVAALEAHPQVRTFKDVASVDVGIVTGANEFFLVPDAVVSEYQLEPWAHPMFGRSEHVQGLLYTPQDHVANKRAGLPANFIWFPEEKFSALPLSVQRYLETGLAASLHTRYKCRVRKPWFRVPSVYIAPIGMLKRAHEYPRLVLNCAGAYSTDTAYRIQPEQKTRSEALVFGFVNSLTCLAAELEGRHYGGGVLELVPSEIERLLVPIVDSDPGSLSAADEAFRKAEDPVAFLRKHDRTVLGAIGLANSEQDLLFEAWCKLRDRRHRASSDDGNSPPSPFSGIS